MPEGRKVSHLPKRVAVGIDASATSTGIVTLDVVTGEVVDARALVPNDRSVRRLEKIFDLTMDWCEEIFPQNTIEHICMEGHANDKFSPQFLLGECAGVMKLGIMRAIPDPVCYPTLVAPQTHKKFVTGSGKGMKKEDVKLWTYKRWGFEHRSNDVVDAYGLAQIARAIMNPDIELIKPQQEVKKGLMLKLHTEAPTEIRYPEVA